MHGKYHPHGLEHVLDEPEHHGVADGLRLHRRHVVAPQLRPHGLRSPLTADASLGEISRLGSLVEDTIQGPVSAEVSERCRKLGERKGLGVLTGSPTGGRAAACRRRRVDRGQNCYPRADFLLGRVADNNQSTAFAVAIFKAHGTYNSKKSLITRSIKKLITRSTLCKDHFHLLRL